MKSIQSHQLLLLVVLHLELCHITSAVDKKWLESEISTAMGHYPGIFCRVTNVVLSSVDQKIYYKNDKSEFKYKVEEKCMWNRVMWSISKSDNKTVECDQVYNSGFFFPIYYTHGSSNYHHLHFDTLMPLYNYIYYNKRTNKNSVLFPGVESSRLKPIDWFTLAFNDETKFWNRVISILGGEVNLIPINEPLVKSQHNICLKAAHFGTPKTDYGDHKFMTSFVQWVKGKFNVSHERLNNQRVGLIQRFNRRRILNENELVNEIKQFVDADLVRFDGLTFKQQVQLVQNYTVLLGMNGAGLMNSIYLPPGAVTVQLVPYKAQLDVTKQAKIYSARGAYLEWHNKHIHNVPELHASGYSQSDTVVHVDEFVSLVKQAMDLVNSDLIKDEL